MIPNYELYLMRMAQAMSEELKKSIKLPHVEHSLFGKIIRRGETRRQMEREAESLHRGEESLVSRTKEARTHLRTCVGPWGSRGMVEMTRGQPKTSIIPHRGGWQLTKSEDW